MTIKIYLGDCIDIARQHIPNESVDLVFADPPFNVGKKYGNGHDDKRTDYYEWCAEWIDECFRVLKDTGTFYLMTIPRHLGKLYPMMDSRGVFINHVNWRNVSANHSKRGFWSSTQPILVYGKTTQFVFNIYAQTRDTNKLQKRWGGYNTEAKGTFLDYWDDIPFVYAGSIAHPEAILKPGTNQKLHPAQIPIALIRRAIVFSTNEGDTVYEPFGGLCAGAVACHQTNRNYIASEQNGEYVRIAEKRASEAQGMVKRARGEPSPLPLSDSVTQMDLFS